MPYDNIEDIWKYLLIKADISLVSDFWFEAPKKFFYSTNLKDIESMRFCQNILSPFWASFFKNLNFFHFTSMFEVSEKPLETFLWTLRACSRYLKSSQRLYLCASKKIMTVRHTNQIICREKWKKLRFLKNEAQNGDRIFWQKLMFWAETFIQVSLINFL